MTDRSQSQSSNSLSRFPIFLFNTFLSLPSFLNVGKGNGHIISTTNTSKFKRNFYFVVIILAEKLSFNLRENVNKQNSSSPSFHLWLVQVGLVFPCQKILLLEKRSSWMTTEASKVSVVVCEDDAGLSTIWKAWLQFDSLIFNDVWIWSSWRRQFGSGMNFRSNNISNGQISKCGVVARKKPFILQNILFWFEYVYYLGFDLVFGSFLKKLSLKILISDMVVFCVEVIFLRINFINHQSSF